LIVLIVYFLPQLTTQTEVLPYVIDDEGRCVLTDNKGKGTGQGAEGGASGDSKSPLMLANRLKKLLKALETSQRLHIKEKFLSDLRKARDSLKGEELRKVREELKKVGEKLRKVREELRKVREGLRKVREEQGWSGRGKKNALKGEELRKVREEPGWREWGKKNALKGEELRKVREELGWREWGNKNAGRM
jgi:hypothetical protein